MEVLTIVTVTVMFEKQDSVEETVLGEKVRHSFYTPT
jgi:hypothetical protein